jgi:hypothetical protein|tara:strand:- start:13 stop:504 length:492 start_codon:yes stop_codon:yes gene_type:complete
MTFLQIILLSSLFTIIFIILHFAILYLLSYTKTIQTVLPFILSNLICIYLTRDLVIKELFYSSFIINLTILIVYVEFLLLMKKGFTLSIITSFKKKKKLSYNELVKNYADGRGAKWILLNRLEGLSKLKIIKLNKKIKLNTLGSFLSILLIFLRKVFAIKDFG